MLELEVALGRQAGRQLAPALDLGVELLAESTARFEIHSRTSREIAPPSVPYVLLYEQKLPT